MDQGFVSGSGRRGKGKLMGGLLEWERVGLKDGCWESSRATLLVARKEGQLELQFDLWKGTMMETLLGRRKDSLLGRTTHYYPPWWRIEED